MTNVTRAPWRVQDELIEQPSWGGRYIVDLKGLGDDPQWKDKKVGAVVRTAPRTLNSWTRMAGRSRGLADLIKADPDPACWGRRF